MQKSGAESSALSAYRWRWALEAQSSFTPPERDQPHTHEKLVGLGKNRMSDTHQTTMQSHGSGRLGSSMLVWRTSEKPVSTKMLLWQLESLLPHINSGAASPDCQVSVAVFHHLELLRKLKFDAFSSSPGARDVYTELNIDGIELIMGEDTVQERGSTMCASGIQRWALRKPCATSPKVASQEPMLADSSSRPVPGFMECGVRFRPRAPSPPVCRRHSALQGFPRSNDTSRVYCTTSSRTFILRQRAAE